jgi:hypothetical protein
MSRISVALMAIHFLALVSCCELTQEKERIPGIREALLKSKSNSYVDSAGQRMYLLIESQETEIAETSDLGNCTYADRKLEYPVVDWKQFPNFGLTVSYIGLYNNYFMQMDGQGVMLSGQSLLFSFSGMNNLFVFDRSFCDTTSVSLQGKTYSRVLLNSMTDSVGQVVQQFAIDMDYGLILMNVPGQYRWERIPN